MAFEMAQNNHRMQELLNQLGLSIDHYFPNYVPATIPHTNELITALRNYFEPVPLIDGQLPIHDLYGAGLPYIKWLMDNAIVKHKAQIESAKDILENHWLESSESLSIKTELEWIKLHTYLEDHIADIDSISTTYLTHIEQHQQPFHISYPGSDRSDPLDHSKRVNFVAELLIQVVQSFLKFINDSGRDAFLRLNEL